MKTQIQTDSFQKPTANSFSGPLFIVGMQRSGTKLLCSLLRGHEQVRMLLAESEFLPYWVNHWGEFGDLSQVSTFNAFYQTVQSLPYFIYTKNRDSIQRRDGWYALCQDFTPAGVFEALMRYDNGVGHGSNLIWGDKSPSYMKHLALIQSLFPDARVIHIIRDVRDYCLSQAKAWNKNPARAAQKWVDSIEQAHKDTQLFSDRYLEVKYEDLLESPEVVLQQCCSFLGIAFSNKMLELSRPPENIGDAKGLQNVKSDNKNKYLTEMNPKMLRRIEAIAAPTLRQLNYPVSYEGHIQRLSSFEMNYLKGVDAFNFFIHELKRKKDLTDTVKLFVGNYLLSRG